MAELPVPSPITIQAVRFARYLRQVGMPVSPAQTLDFVHCLTWIDIVDRGSVRAAARAVFVQRRDDIAPFEAAFERFWSNTVLDPRAKRGMLEDLRREPIWALDSFQVSDAAELAEDAPDRALVYSPAERLRQRDFGALTGAEAAGIQAAIFAIARRLPLRRSRRLQPDRRGRQLDLRTTLRTSVRTGGDPFLLVRRKRKAKPRPLVLLCDVSGS